MPHRRTASSTALTGTRPSRCDPGAISSWRIESRYIVQMDPQRYHLHQQVEGRGHMLHPSLGRPRLEACDIDPLFDAYCPVLMPSQRPVHFIRLVEHNRSDSSQARSQNLGGDRADWPVRRQKRTQGFDASNPHARPMRRQMRQSLCQRIDAVPDCTGEQLCSVQVEPKVGLHQRPPFACYRSNDAATACPNAAPLWGA